MRDIAYGHSLKSFPREADGSRRLMKATKHKKDHTRGVTETLRQMPDDSLILTTDKWSNWAGEETTTTEEEVPWAELGPGGRFEIRLGVPNRGRD